jgi:hypothetical protein
MPAVLLGVIVLIAVLWALKAFSKADPRLVIRSLRVGSGIAALAGAAVFVLIGREGLALPLGIGGLSLLGLWPGMSSFGKRAKKSPGQVSRVRSAFVEMELDHDSGVMRGRILAGKHEGASIDEESQALLATYLDRRQPGWRENTQADPASGSGGGAPRGGPMTHEEAYQILGLQPGAGTDEIARAHRALMKKLHPDQGGSTYLAARVNAAKDILLRRHR